MDRPDRRAHRPRTAIRRGAHARGTSSQGRRGKRALPMNFDSLLVAESATHPELMGRNVTDVAQERGCTPLDFMLDLSLEENLDTRFTSVLANNDPEAIAWLLPQDTVLLGLADSGAHVSQLCDACFATDLLGNWVRDKEVMPLEHAIHKLTGEPAGVFGLDDRGTLEVGKAADVVVFDYDTVAPGPLRRIRDFPADGERLVADKPVGMRHVLVNGTVIREDEAAGRRRARAAPGQAPALVTRAERQSRSSRSRGSLHASRSASGSGLGPGRRAGCSANTAGKHTRNSPSSSSAITPRSRKCGCCPISSGVSTGVTGAPAAVSRSTATSRGSAAHAARDRGLALLEAVEPIEVAERAELARCRAPSHTAFQKWSSAITPSAIQPPSAQRNTP